MVNFLFFLNLLWSSHQIYFLSLSISSFRWISSKTCRSFFNWFLLYYCYSFYLIHSYLIHYRGHTWYSHSQEWHLLIMLSSWWNWRLTNCMTLLFEWFLIFSSWFSSWIYTHPFSFLLTDLSWFWLEQWASSFLLIDSWSYNISPSCTAPELMTCEGFLCA